jgi:hypothetical protein
MISEMKTELTVISLQVNKNSRYRKLAAFLEMITTSMASKLIFALRKQHFFSIAFMRCICI